MHNYEAVEDFAASESFQDFVLEKNSSAISIWQEYIIDNPDQLEKIELASNIVKQLSPGEIIAMKKPLHHPGVNNNLSQLMKIMPWLMAIIVLSISTYYIYSAVNKDQPIEYIAIDSIRTITLQDGSELIMKPQSSVKVIGDWGKERYIESKGTIYYDVKSESDRPFVVSTSKGKIQVLGTKFEVIDQDKFSLVLIEGSVNFKTKRNTYQLVPDEMISLENGSFIKQSIDAAAFSYWKEDKLAFNNEKLSRVVFILNKSYGMNITVLDDSLLEKSISAQVPENNPTLILSAISEIYGIELIKKGDEFILK